ncbi:PspC domain-containing protein [Antrihabitans sp. YC2-6]|uniref:PspC domain-containing protein n=1 Tax=Antrihabitans sp. YC2-6 TaxID=2799498 RepID=UPI0018F483B2|nr:PspC domain-containing protein [Antrihabitans sp. YC2-6]MBJ8348751.1 PspC domain-containing protein [Antrihabitans sp. YC2-6]
MTAPVKQLTRSRQDKMIGGVCAGIADYMGWSPQAVRIGFIASCLLPGPQFLVYLALWVVIPQREF